MDAQGVTSLSAADHVSLIRPEQRVPSDPTPGLFREQAIAVHGMWAGLVRTDAHMVSGWHHHGDHDTAIYVVSGALRMESGPGGAVVVDAQPGDFLHVPKGAVHRESNPEDTESQVVVIRSGQGPVVVNVDSPAPTDSQT
jgi:uncharacterized RmlC-like cupin family protein